MLPGAQCPPMFEKCQPKASVIGLLADLELICLTQAFWAPGPRALPTACQPGLQRGVRGVSPRPKEGSKEALLPLLDRRILPATQKAGPPYSKGGPPLLERRTPLTRKAGLPYPKGGPSLLARRTPLTRKADPPYSQGGYSLLERRMYSLLERRILFKPSPRQAALYSEGGYSLLGRRVLPGGPPSLGADVTCSAQRILLAPLSGYYLLP